MVDAQRESFKKPWVRAIQKCLYVNHTLNNSDAGKYKDRHAVSAQARTWDDGNMSVPVSYHTAKYCDRQLVDT